MYPFGGALGCAFRQLRRGYVRHSAGSLDLIGLKPHAPPGDRGFPELLARIGLPGYMPQLGP